MFEEDYQYFPSLREIRDGLIRAQQQILEKEKLNWSDKTKFDLLILGYEEQWKFLFDIPKLGNLDKPLKPEILSNPNHKVTKHLLYIYSMECFVYKELNIACRSKDRD